jgi:hypothetical protein
MLILVWEAIGRKVGGEQLGEVTPIVQKALKMVSELGVKYNKGARIGPAHDGQCLTVVDGIFREGSF